MVIALVIALLFLLAFSAFFRQFLLYGVIAVVAFGGIFYGILQINNKENARQQKIAQTKIQPAEIIFEDLTIYGLPTRGIALSGAPQLSGRIINNSPEHTLAELGIFLIFQDCQTKYPANQSRLQSYLDAGEVEKTEDIEQIGAHDQEEILDDVENAKDLAGGETQKVETWEDAPIIDCITILEVPKVLRVNVPPKQARDFNEYLYLQGIKPKYDLQWSFKINYIEALH